MEQKWSSPCPLHLGIQASGGQCTGILKSPSLPGEDVGWESAKTQAGGCSEELPPWGWDAAPDGRRGAGRGPAGRYGHCRADDPAMFMGGKPQEMFHIALIVPCRQTSAHTRAHPHTVPS